MIKCVKRILNMSWVAKELVEKDIRKYHCISRNSSPNTGSKNPLLRVYLKNCVQFWKSHFKKVQTNSSNAKDDEDG